MSKTTKLLRTLVVVGVVGGIAALGVFSAFTSQAENPGNLVSAGSVTLTDNDGGTALYNITAAEPGQASTPTCIRVACSGSLDADVKLYTPSTIGALGPDVTLKIESGTQTTPSFPDCTGFTAETTLFSRALDLPDQLRDRRERLPGHHRHEVGERRRGRLPRDRHALQLRGRLPAGRLHRHPHAALGGAEPVAANDRP